MNLYVAAMVKPMAMPAAQKLPASNALPPENVLSNAHIDALLDACKKGDHKAFAKFYHLFAPKMYGVCLRFSRDVSEAQDNLQDGFVKVFSHLKDYRGEGSLEGWIRRIMVHTALERFRKKNPLHWSAELPANLPEIEPLEGVDNYLNVEDVLQLVRELPDGYRMVFNLYAIEGYAHKEIADMLSISEGTSKSQLARARQQLQQRIRETMPDLVPHGKWNHA
jgi:RNA polymerase sigma factor (sigma-70 family)